jgi:hypothetical protein
VVIQSAATMTAPADLSTGKIPGMRTTAIGMLDLTGVAISQTAAIGEGPITFSSVWWLGVYRTNTER